MTNTIQACTKCLMDTSDSDIQFNEDGVCSHCTNYAENLSKHWVRGPEGEAKLKDLISYVKMRNKSADYDCVIGLSGGVDSSYLLLKAVEWGLKPLAVHVDAGWNSELAVKNIENLVKTCGVDLVTHVVNWSEIKDLQLAFLKSGVANQDIPQDHCFTAAVYKTAKQYGIKDMLGGSNLSTECILPTSWGYNAMDLRHIKSIHKQFGKKKLKTYPTMNFFEYYVYFPRVLKVKTHKPLDLMDYSKEDAMKELQSTGWTYYGGKHFESRFTKFFQSYYLVERFGYDKRKAHLSSLIVTGQMTLEDGLKELAKPIYDESQVLDDKEFIAKKLGISLDEFEQCMSMDKKTYLDYKNNEYLFELKDKIKKIIS
ncbi:N-acetyl sugar amidotransferase [Aliivibrio salmonicida]|uniref:N-acetyl sugar amidotransferase n=1 Tax=Aliivibrio salmonicida TaxID=40269 RepID=UPI00406C90D7